MSVKVTDEHRKNAKQLYADTDWTGCEAEVIELFAKAIADAEKRGYERGFSVAAASFYGRPVEYHATIMKLMDPKVTP